jgi:hypothetical protein
VFFQSEDRFLTFDPELGDKENPITQNGYAYADNNLVMLVDPDGNRSRIRYYIIKYGSKYGKKAKNKIKSSWKNRKWSVQGPDGKGRLFAIVNRKKKQTKTTDSRWFGLDYHRIRENKKRTTRSILHYHWNYKKNKHYFIYPTRKKTKWE